MKICAQILVLSIVVLFSQSVQAEETDKKITIGIGTYALKIAYDNFEGNDDELSGFGVSASYAFTDNFSIRGGYYALEHDDTSAIEVTGIDLVAYFGTGLASQGFKAYIGGGIFDETWELLGFEEDFGGIQLSGGLGYNWDAVALDFVLGVRDTSDYENFILSTLGETTDAVAVSGSLLLSARF